MFRIAVLNSASASEENLLLGLSDPADQSLCLAVLACSPTRTSNAYFWAASIHWGKFQQYTPSTAKCWMSIFYAERRIDAILRIRWKHCTA